LSETIVSTIQVCAGEDKDKVAASWGSGSKVIERALANIDKSGIVSTSTSGITEL
jgi:hypothetical protein